MKKLLAIILTIVIAFSMVACGTSVASNKDKGAPKSSNDNITVTGVYVDSSYADKSNSVLKLLYVFMDVKSTDKNLKFSSASVDIKIGENSYSSSFLKGQCDYMPNYYYSSFIEELYVGNEIKLALTFKVPEGDLTGGKTISFEDFDLPVNGIKISTDEIITLSSKEEIAQKADTEGYNEIAQKKAPADEARVSAVKNYINGGYFTFYVTVGQSIQTYELEFIAPSSFELRTSIGSNNGGTYTVQNNYIFCTYSSTGHVVEIPYEINEAGEVELDCDSAFSIYE